MTEFHVRSSAHPLRRRDVTGLLVGLTGAAVLGACAPAPKASGGPAAAAVPVPTAVPVAQLKGTTLKVADQKAGLASVLTAAGLADTPYDVEWSTFTSGPPLLEALAAGAADVGGVGNTPPIFAGAAGSAIAIVSAGRDTAAGDAILIGADSTLTSVAQLKGLKVAVAKGSSAHGHLILQLHKAGMSSKDVDIAFVAPSDGYAALATGRVDAWAVWDPYTAQAQQELHAKALAVGTGVANGLSFQAASRDALADPHRNAAIRDLVLRSVRARQWAKANVKTWIPIYAKETGLPHPVASLSVRRSDDDPVLLTDEIVTAEQTLVDALAAEKVIPTSFTFASYVDHRYDSDVSHILQKKG